MEKIIIAAISPTGVIGIDGRIPWDITKEMEFFKKTTIGYPVIMGRKTYESLKKPLVKRLNIVLSRNIKDIQKKRNFLFFKSLHSALKFCEMKNFDKVFVIGGAEIYKTAINKIDRMIISRIHNSYPGNTYFPEFNKKEWEEKIVSSYSEFDVYEYRRITS